MKGNNKLLVDLAEFKARMLLKELMFSPIRRGIVHEIRQLAEVLQWIYPRKLTLSKAKIRNKFNNLNY